MHSPTELVIFLCTRFNLKHKTPTLIQTTKIAPSQHTQHIYIWENYLEAMTNQTTSQQKTAHMRQKINSSLIFFDSFPNFMAILLYTHLGQHQTGPLQENKENTIQSAKFSKNTPQTSLIIYDMSPQESLINNKRTKFINKLRTNTQPIQYVQYTIITIILLVSFFKFMETQNYTK
jgi:hypothetical protein